MSADITLRAATTRDAPAMVLLVDIAGHGLPLHFWTTAVRRGEAVSALEVGYMRALREEADFSWKKATIAELDGEVAGMLTGYLLPARAPVVDLGKLDPVVRPLVELEALAPSTWYVNVLAAFARFRRLGVGTALIGRAGEIARAVNARGVSLIVEDTNEAARRLYEDRGFREVARRPFHAFDGAPEVYDWILMVRPL
jgi:ribosomal protein S18 acetylase RimI-like enzyme